MPQDRTRAYTEAGVDINRAQTLVERIKSIASSTHTRGVFSDIGGFGGLFRLNATHYDDPLLVASTDGVGTKLKLAFLFKRHETVGIDLVAMSANDILVQGANPLFFLDYYACGRLEPDICATVIEGIAEGCKQAGCALLGGETAEMPEMYPEGEYDLAGFCVGIVDNSRLVDGSEVTIGDAIIGIASSGLHSNGFSLVRKLLKESGLSASDPFPGDPGKTVADVLLAPTTIYVEAVLPLLRDIRIKGMAHITGGGFYENIPRTLPSPVAAKIEFGSWKVGPVFEWLKTCGSLSWEEMLQIFNCGIGFVLILPQDQAEETISRIRAFNLEAWQIGEIVNRPREENGDRGEQVLISFSSSD